jgi:acetyltransferase-like isoleucine patch superfamily enzyme
MEPFAIPGVKAFEYTKIVGLENIEFGHDIIIDDFVLIHAEKKTKLGNYVHIGSFSSLIGGEEISIGDFSCVSLGCRIFTGLADTQYWGFGNVTIPEKYRNIKRSPIRIDRFVIIGANSMILPGVIVGEGAVVKPYSIVTPDLKPWGVYNNNMRIETRDENAVLNTYQRFISEMSEELRTI